MVAKRIAILGFAASVLGSTNARADATRAEPIRVDFRAPAVCPVMDAFTADLRARTPRVRDAKGDEAAWQISVSVDVDGAEPRGRLSMKTPAGRDSVRELTGPTCEEVVDALALIAALAIDPEASTAPIAKPPPSPKEASATTSPAPIAPVSTPPTSSPAATADVPRWSWSAGVQATMTSAPAPEPLFGGRIVVESTRKGPAFWSPAIRVAVGGALPRSIENNDGTTRFRWGSSEVEGCFFQWSLAVATAIGPCGAIDVGLLDVTASNGTTHRESTRPWLSGGASQRIAWFPASTLALEVQGGAIFPVIRDRFHFDTRAPVQDVPWVGF
jgi:hypothetical protein